MPQLFPSLDHDDVVSESGLDLRVFRVCGRAGLEFVRDLFEGSVETAADFPAEGAACLINGRNC